MIDFPAAYEKCAPDINPATMLSIVRHESNVNPFAIGINGDLKLTRQPRDKEEAVATAQWLEAKGYNFDAGLGQVNIKNRAWLGMSIADLFDPCANIRGASKILLGCYKRAALKFGVGQGALRAALSCYNTGNFTKGIANGYVHKVIASNEAVLVPEIISEVAGKKEATKVAPIILERAEPVENINPDTSKEMPVQLPEKENPVIVF